MEFKDQLDLTGVFSAIIAGDSGDVRFGLALDKINTVSVALLESVVEQNVFQALKTVKVLVGNDSGKSQEVFLFDSLLRGEIESIPDGWQLTEEEAINLVASDMASRAIQDIQHLGSQKQREKLAAIEMDFAGYLSEKYLDEILSGKLVVAGVKAIDARAESYSETPWDNADDGELINPFSKMGMALIFLGDKESPARILFLKKIKTCLDQIMRAVSAATKKLKERCSESFNYLVALIEESLLARVRQYDKAPSKKTMQVQRDMSSIFVNPLIAQGFDHDWYGHIFNEDYDSFARLGCAGDTGAQRTKRSKHKRRLLEVFAPLLTEELRAAFCGNELELEEFSQFTRWSGLETHLAEKKQSFTQDINIIVNTLCDWIASIGYKKHKE